MRHAVCNIATFGCYRAYSIGGEFMRMEHWNTKGAAQTMTGAGEAATGIADAQDVAAALLLARVEAMLREGQPRQAIAHICDMTGVDRGDAEGFVADLKGRVFATG